MLSSRCCCMWAVALLLLVGACSAQGPSASADCNAALVSLLPCLDYVQANVSSPSQSCCVGAKAVVENTPSCLCTLFNASALPISVNRVRVSELPAACNVTAPPPNLCGGVLAPAVAPATAVPPPSPTVSPTPTVSPSTPPVAPPLAAPAVTPSVAPSAPTPAPTPATTSAPTPTPATTPAPTPATVSPASSPAIAPSSATLPSSTPPPPVVSTPPAAPPSQNHGTAAVASFLMSFAFVLPLMLFLQA